jgi:acetyl-CoA C-acetyltransferase
MNKKVAVVGIGHTKFGRFPDATLRELAAVAGFSALEDAGITSPDIDFLSVGVASGSLSGQLSPAASVADALGITGAPLYRSEAACATGSAAIRSAYTALASGASDIALVVGAELMTRVPSAKATEYLAEMGDYGWEYPHGITFPGYFGLIASAHMKEFGTTEEDLALVAVKNHENAYHNEYAQFRKRITVDDVLKSKMVAYPLKLLDCSPLSDGASALVLTTEEHAKDLSDTPVWIEANALASLNNLAAERKDLATIPSVRLAAKKAYAQSGLGPKDIDFAEVHDCFTIAEIVVYEELGFSGRGKGAELVRSDQTSIGGEIPVNPSGGLKAKGHPLGATGVSMAVEVVKQFRGEVERRRYVGGEVALTQNMGLTGQYSFVTIYRRG